MDQGQPVRRGVYGVVGPVPGGPVQPHSVGGAHQGVGKDHGDAHKGPGETGERVIVIWKAI